jgi:Spy/CpxP family protein refolding chaperone
MNPVKKTFVALALAGSTLVGGAVGATMLGTAGAQTSAPSTAPAAPATQQAPDSPRGAHDPSLGGHVGQNGVKEELLTGDTAQKVKDAALAANPGGTVERVENDAEGSPYEAHMTKADGTHITVKVDANFNVTSTENGPR